MMGEKLGTFLYDGHKSAADGYVGSANDPPKANIG